MKRPQTRLYPVITGIKPCFIIGAGGRSRTDMSISSLDFESSASTNFTTPAWGGILPHIFIISQEERIIVSYLAVSKKTSRSL